MEVYDAIKSVDTLNAEKPFLMKLDLPIPQKCILEEEKSVQNRAPLPRSFSHLGLLHSNDRLCHMVPTRQMIN